ncbi:DUF4440 domain-containing protein [Nocardia cyriacigeorgica]|uniref:DUF4440 domain-containing protein n=1 Tax=Nocardia cyriacigeorgica TaxID=135487 RepID=A0A6P1CV43_9NOCA|nr:nuclear transport factor 2 family protein [Nocardia cyriacigeorgica]MBF6427562.1 nuclear transport factor 2 family protein [Nocardia cyriacigeorgica]NEW36391.1 DUF4440 domain-containing protein [Nocardia cyriacigeorgica]
MSSSEVSPAPTDRDVTAHAEIRRRIDTLIEALHAKDLDIIARCYTRDVVSFDVEPPLQHAGIAAKLDNWKRVFAVFDTVRYEMRELRFTVGDEVAFGHAFARLHGTLTHGAATDGMWVRVSYGMRRVDGVWLIAHDQVSVPLDIASGRGVVDLEP